MKKPLFSLVYPTRHRPQFIRMALKFLKQQGFEDFEIIVSDNYSDATLSCESVVNRCDLKNVRYVHPDRDLSMVDHWNFAYAHALGDYIAFFTDKMFLLPGVLQACKDTIDLMSPEVITWNYDIYSPRQFPDYFDPGYYFPQEPIGSVKAYEPRHALTTKCIAAVPREQQDHWTYAQGKICFGMFSRALCERIIASAGKLFHPISPDYTSMILGLSYAKSAAMIGISGIVHINTDLSNGGQAAANESYALNFLMTLGVPMPVLSADMLVPGLYASQHNIVAHDYIRMKKRYKLDITLRTENWLLYIALEIFSAKRNWSSKEIEIAQKRLFIRYLRSNLAIAEQRKIIRNANKIIKQETSQLHRADTSPEANSLGSSIKKWIRRVVKKLLTKIRESVMKKPTALSSTTGNLHMRKIEDILMLYVQNIRQQS